MTLLWLLRHGSTAWNEEGRIQGRRDIALSEAGRAQVRAWHLPRACAGASWLSSPLQRARDTARLLGTDSPGLDWRLAEASWGEWEGRRLAELRDRLGAEMARLEARGLDFRPPGGESPREVQERVLPLLAEIARSRRDAMAITHKGVIRAVYSLAAGWPLLGKPPHRLARDAVHGFRLGPDGRPSIHRLNAGLGGK